MSLFHASDKLNNLSERRYNGDRKDIPKILQNYFFHTRNFLTEIIKVGRKRPNINFYTLKRLILFQEKIGLHYTKMETPGTKVRSQWWTDPRVEFGLQNRRHR